MGRALHDDELDVAPAPMVAIAFRWCANRAPVTAAERFFSVPVQIPPMIFHYRVPEGDRAFVEAAIRACGKWAQ